MLKYRADIDGLRAIAVLPVLLFHAHVPGFAGGFVGVDVFFVISGFLITSILTRDLDAGRFSIVRFYEKRFRRLLPALFTLFGTVAAAASLLLSPEQMKRLGTEMAAASLFASNLYFTRTSDYFSPGAEEKMFLHTWSLAVEEQFYLFFPVLLWLVGRHVTRRRIAVATVAALSFALSVGLSAIHPTTSFYLLHTRAWELMFGAFLAVGLLRAPTSRTERDVASLVGLALIGLSVLTFDASTVFPGAVALLPVIGTTLVLHAGRDGTSLGGRWLQAAPLVFVGKLSYSLYLWHWPALLLGWKLNGGDVTLPVSLTALVVSFGLAYASLRLVEAPLRHIQATTARVIGTAVVASLCFAGLGLGIRTLRPSAHGEEALRLGNPGSADRACIGQTEDFCQWGDGPPSVVVIGDSHAHALLDAWEELAEVGGHPVQLRAHSGCAPLLGTTREGDDACLAHTEAVLDLPESVRAVILAGRWALSVEQTKPEAHDEAVVVSHRSGATGPDAVRLGLEQTVERLLEQDVQVLLLEGVPEQRFDVPAVLALRAHLGQEPPAVRTADVDERNRRTDTLLRGIAAGHAAVEVVQVRDLLCDETSCRLGAEGVSLFRDAHHLSNEGSAYLMERGLRERLLSALD